MRGAGLAQVLSTSDVAEWEAATSCRVGHHHSHLLDPDEGFEAHYRIGSTGPLQLPHIRGRGRVELGRTQQARVVLWLLLLGSSDERLNGTLMAVEPGMALLLRPGEEMLGRASEDLEGISVLIPESLLTGSGPSLLERGARAREAIDQALALAESTALGQPGVEHGALALGEAPRIWQQELDHPPLTEARRLRLRLLRAHLLDPDQCRTAWDYRGFWGALPRRTRQRLGERDSAAEDGIALGWARTRSSLDC